MDFFEKLINNFKDIFKKLHDKEFTNQNVDSIRALYDLCIDFKPDSLIEIGTNYGCSTLSFLLAMKVIGGSPSDIITVDLNHDFWDRTQIILKDFLSEYGLDVSEVKKITQDFNTIDPKKVVDANKKTLLFYDMHDHKGPWSQGLIDKWLPLINGMVIIHDISSVNESYKIVLDESSPRSMARHFSGQFFAGFMECERIINWTNDKRINLGVFPGGVYFKWHH